MVRDFTPTAEQISLHGLGFLQVKLPGNKRLHAWHPALPQRACFDFSPIHNHRFSFRSTVLVGEQVNRRYAVWDDPEGSHDLISHDGPRSEKGGRLSYVAGRVSVRDLHDERYRAGESYVMPELHYHETPNEGVVVTLMEKLTERTDCHANSLIEHGRTFDQQFDRFQMPEAEMWAIFLEALRS